MTAAAAIEAAAVVAMSPTVVAVAPGWVRCRLLSAQASRLLLLCSRLLALAGREPCTREGMATPGVVGVGRQEKLSCCLPARVVNTRRAQLPLSTHSW